MHRLQAHACIRFVGIFLSGLGAALQYWRDHDEEWAPDIFHHYGFQAMGAGAPWHAGEKLSLPLLQRRHFVVGLT